LWQNLISFLNINDKNNQIYKSYKLIKLKTNFTLKCLGYITDDGEGIGSPGSTTSGKYQFE